jgi:hypothetical protein
MKFLSALLLLAVPSTQGALSFYNGFFNDPNAPANTLLDIWVDTVTCISTLQVTVAIPAGGVVQSEAGGPVNLVLSGNTFNSQFFTGVIDGANPVPSTLASADIAFSYNAGDQSSLTTFTGFTDSYTLGPGLAPAFFTTAGTAISVNVPDYLLVGATYVAQPLQIVGNFAVVPTAHAIQIASGNGDYYKHLFTVTQLNPDCQGFSPPGGSGDPVFTGFQGQVFQFHGLPDEHFNLISSPDVQLNSHFVYLSSGKCDYNETECFTHPGTYMDILGFSIGGETQVKLVAGTHDAGLRIWLNDAEVSLGSHIRSLSTNTSASLKYHKNGAVEIRTEIMDFEIINSDMFLNIKASLKSPQLLRTGAPRHTVTDRNICKTNSETNDHQLIESTVAKKYPITTPLHGLIGQTWRNVKVCGHDWMGTVQDYIVSSLFGTEYHYNNYKL